MKKQNLTPKQQGYRKVLLSKIHQADRYVYHYAQFEDDYRTMLEDNFGKRSAADLSINQLKLLLDFLNSDSASLITEQITPAQAKYIQMIWKQKANDPSDKALRQLINKLFKKTVISVSVLTKKQANGLINAINRL